LYRNGAIAKVESRNSLGWETRVQKTLVSGIDLRRMPSFYRNED
jgi:hypothetical protein